VSALLHVLAAAALLALNVGGVAAIVLVGLHRTGVTGRSDDGPPPRRN
jgi:hypothetical protein